MKFDISKLLLRAVTTILLELIQEGRLPQGTDQTAAIATLRELADVIEQQ
jgi:hypothetical protein